MSGEVVTVAGEALVFAFRALPMPPKEFVGSPFSAAVEYACGVLEAGVPLLVLDGADVCFGVSSTDGANRDVFDERFPGRRLVDVVAQLLRAAEVRERGAAVTVTPANPGPFSLGRP